MFKIDLCFIIYFYFMGYYYLILNLYPLNLRFPSILHTRVSNYLDIALLNNACFIQEWAIIRI